MNNYTHKAWRQYEAGKQYKRRIDLYAKVKQNEAFWRGEQWSSGEGADLPKPVFNLVRRVADYLVCSVADSRLSLRFTDENLPFVTDKNRQAVKSVIDTLEKNTAYRWESANMDALVHRALTDAVISGDGAFYCYWDSQAKCAGGYYGDIVTELIDSSCIFPADVNIPDIQSQEYVIISGRASVSALRHEAECFGVLPEDCERIVSDTETDTRSGRLASTELEGEDEQKTTFIVKFWREDGKIWFEKSTRDCILRRECTDGTLYPIAYFNWSPVKDCFHGASPISAMIPNQRFINRAYAMAMKHMTDTAFSKIIYDRSKIPEWTNEVGEAIAAMGGGNISDAVCVVSPGKMQDGFGELVNSAVTLTKELMGATESALGNLEAKNTSAILALQQSSRISLGNVRSAFYKCIEDLADIWADMICTYYPMGRLLPTDGESDAQSLDSDTLRHCMLKAHAEVTEMTQYSDINTQSMLDKLLDGGHITAAEYIKRLPAGLVANRHELIEVIEEVSKDRKEVTCG